MIRLVGKFGFRVVSPVYLLTTCSEANCVSPIRRSRVPLPKVKFIPLAEVAVVYPDFVLFEAAEDGGEGTRPRLEFVANRRDSGIVHAGLIPKKEPRQVLRGSGERSTNLVQRR